MSMEDLFYQNEKARRPRRCTGIFRVPYNPEYWQCNLRTTETGYYDYGIGKTPLEALQDATARAEGADQNRPFAPWPCQPLGAPKAPEPEAKKPASIEDLL